MNMASILSRPHPLLSTHARSPLGLFGALYALACFSITIVSELLFDENNLAVVLGVGIILIVSTCYYFIVAKNRQRLAPAEQVKTLRYYQYCLHCRRWVLSYFFSSHRTNMPLIVTVRTAHIQRTMFVAYVITANLERKRKHSKFYAFVRKVFAFVLQ